jgi:hypothetical protein
MRIVTAQELENWLARGSVLEKDGRGPKVVALENGLFLKIFHTRRHPILARLQPAARRFDKNAKNLKRLGIAAPHVVDPFWIDRSKGLSGCLYKPLPGQSIEQLFYSDPPLVMRTLDCLAQFIRCLHQRGIYFRSLHLGNILLLPNGDFGLIDILDLRFKRRPLSRWLINRNFKHLRCYLKRKRLENFPLNELIRHYERVD